MPLSKFRQALFLQLIASFSDLSFPVIFVKLDQKLRLIHPPDNIGEILGRVLVVLGGQAHQRTVQLNCLVVPFREFVREDYKFGLLGANWIRTRVQRLQDWFLRDSIDYEWILPRCSTSD
jgi:hypothetical protein